MGRMTGFLLTLLVLYGALVAFLYTYQRNLIYLPDKNIGHPLEYGLDTFEEIFVTTADDVPIQLWYHDASKGFPTVIYFHGNASHMGNRTGIYAALAEQGFGVLGVSYRGYGKSGGSPSEYGLYNDARAAIGFLKKQKFIHTEHMILYGESLGTGVAVQMATEYPIGMLVLEAPYTAVAARAAEIYFYIPVKLLIQDKFDTLSKIARVKAPMLLFHGERDTTIPVAHGQAVLSAATCRKKAFFFPEVNHNDFDSRLISSHVLDFAKEINLIEN